LPELATAFPARRKSFPDQLENFPDILFREFADLTRLDQSVRSREAWRFWVHFEKFPVFSRLSGTFVWR
jgi:hypothetical protein